MRQKLKDILSDFRTPLQSAGIVFMFLLVFVIVLWAIMALVRIVMG